VGGRTAITVPAPPVPGGDPRSLRRAGRRRVPAAASRRPRRGRARCRARGPGRPALVLARLAGDFIS